MSKNSSNFTISKLAFFTFVLAGVAYLVQAILQRLGVSSEILQTLQSVIVILLFVVTGVSGWKYCRYKKFLHKLLYIICVIIILVAVVLPII